MRVVVSGATGAVGRLLVPALLSRNHDIVVLTRNAARAKAYTMLPRVFVEQADIGKGGAWQTTVHRADAVIHLAAPPFLDGPLAPAQQKTLHSERLRGVQEMVRAILQAPTKPRMLLVASSTAVYGERSDVVDENAVANGTGWIADMFRAVEQEASTLRPSVRVVPLRFAQLLGPQSRLLSVTNAAALPVASRVPFTFVHVADAAALIARAVSSSFDQPLNIVAPHATVLALHQALRLPPPSTPSGIGRLLGKRAPEVAPELVLAGQAVKSSYAQSLGYYASFETLDAIVKAARAAAR
jgi:uncharacterized protein